MRDAKKLEGIQPRATKMVTELRRMSYVGVYKFETRSKRGHLIQIYKIIQGLEELDWGINVHRDRPELAHKYQIHRKSCGKCPLRGYFLLNRTAITLNLLPSVVVNVSRQLMALR